MLLWKLACVRKQACAGQRVWERLWWELCADLRGIQRTEFV